MVSTRQYLQKEEKKMRGLITIFDTFVLRVCHDSAATEAENCGSQGCNWPGSPCDPKRKQKRSPWNGLRDSQN